MKCWIVFKEILVADECGFAHNQGSSADRPSSGKHATHFTPFLPFLRWSHEPMARRRGVTRERVLPEPLLQLFLHSLLLVSQHFIMLSAPRSCILMSDPHFHWIHTLTHLHTHTHIRGNFEVLLQHTEVEDGGEKLQPFTVF